MSAPPDTCATETTRLLGLESASQVSQEQQHSGPSSEEGPPRRHWAVAFGSETLRATKGTLLCTWANVLLFCVPLGIVAGTQEWDDTWVFVINFLAIFPLAEILSYSTEELSASVGEIFGGLINATFGNAVEMIVGITALNQNEIAIVQSAMVGSILSGMLLILGTCFFAGGLRRKQLKFNIEVAGLMSSLMIVSAAALIVPSALFADMANKAASTTGSNSSVLSLSRSASVILLLFYMVYLYFSVKSHCHLFQNESQNSQQPLHPVAAMVVLVIATVAVSVCSDHLVDSVDGFVTALHVSRAFVGLIIVPIVGNAGEYATTVKWALGDKLDLAIGVIVGSTLQISLFVIPFMVILGWILQKDMSLRFDTFQTTVTSLSVLVVNCLVRGGRTNYFEGYLLIAAYFVIAIALFVHPDIL